MRTDANLKALLDEELALQFEKFDNTTALALGLAITERAQSRELPITVDIARGQHQLFHAALGGTSADNDIWIKRKNAVVNRFGHSSLYVGAYCEHRKVEFADFFRVDLKEFAANGGAFPIVTKNAGLIGTVAASGLSSIEDHQLITGVIKVFLEKQLAAGV